MVTMGMNKLSAPACHALNEPPEGFLRNFLQFSKEGLFQLLEGLRKVLHLPNASSKNVPNVLYWVQVWDSVCQSIPAKLVWCWYARQCVDEHYHA